MGTFCTKLSNLEISCTDWTIICALIEYNIFIKYKIHTDQSDFKHYTRSPSHKYNFHSNLWKPRGCTAHINSTLPKQQSLLWQKKKKATQVYTNIQLDFIGREINTILLKWKLTFRLGDDTTIRSQGLLIYYPLAELRYLAVHAVLSHWKRSLNGLDYCNLRCWLSARGYSPTAGSAEECACYRLPRHYHS